MTKFMQRVLAILAFTLSGAAVSQETCGYCLQLDKLSVFNSYVAGVSTGFFWADARPLQPGDLELTGPGNYEPVNKHALTATDPSLTVESLVRRHHVCEGPLMSVPTSYFVNRGQAAPNAGYWFPATLGASLPKGALGVCDGELIDLDAYRKKIAMTALTDELKRVQALVNDKTIAAQVENSLATVWYKQQRQEFLTSVAKEVLQKLKTDSQSNADASAPAATPEISKDCSKGPPCIEVHPQ